MTFYIKNFDGNYHRTMREFTKTRPHLVVTATGLSDSSPQELVVEAKLSREELDDFIAKLNRGAVQFQYYKKDGILRNACGTRMPVLMSEQDVEILDQALAQEKSQFLIPYYDFQKKELRQFHVSRFIKSVQSVPVQETQAPSVKRAIEDGRFGNFDQLRNPSLSDILDITNDGALNHSKAAKAGTEAIIREILTRNFTASPSKIDEVVAEIMQEVF